MKARYLHLLRYILSASDLVLLNVCLLLGFNLSAKIGHYSENPVTNQNIMICNLIWFISIYLFKLYSDDTIHRFKLIFIATWRGIALHAALFLTYLFFSSEATTTKEFIVCFYGFLVSGFVLSRFTSTALLDFFITNVDVRKAVAVLGLNRDGIELAAYLEDQKHLKFMGFLDEDALPIDTKKELRSSTLLSFSKASKLGVKEVYVSLSPKELSEVPDLVIQAEKQHLRLKFVPALDSGDEDFRIDSLLM